MYFSIIIPIYNAEKKLEKCLESINKQEFHDYEVILIDDGSMDNSFNICKKYERNNPVYHVIQQRNSGPSSARNAGIDLARGEWICFIDSDDYIEKNYLQELKNGIDQYGADIVFIGYHKVYKDGKKECFVPNEVDANKNRTIVELSERDMFGYTWVKAFKRQAIKEIRFDNTMNLFEDEVFTCQVIRNCTKIGVVKKPIYNYIVDDKSSLVGRTHEDYCIKRDKVYKTWKYLLDGWQEYQSIIEKKANEYVKNCFFYAFERSVSLHYFFMQLSETDFFQEHTENTYLDEFVRKCKYKRLWFEKLKYQVKVTISLLIHRKRLK